MFALVVAGFRQGQLCFTVLCLYRPMYIFSSRGILSGPVVSNSLMPLSSDIRLQESRGFARGSCVLRFYAFIVRCSPSVIDRVLPRIGVLNMFMPLSSNIRLK